MESTKKTLRKVAQDLLADPSGVAKWVSCGAHTAATCAECPGQHVDIQTFNAVLRNCGVVMKESVVSQLFSQLDEDGDGFLEYAEFVHVSSALGCAVLLLAGWCSVTQSVCAGDCW